MITRKPLIITDGGPWAIHDQACAVCWETGEKAVIDVQTRIFLPSWEAQEAGWMLIRPPRWMRRFLKRYQP